MSGVVEQILSLSGLVAYGAVAVLAFAECGTLLGLVLPGELAVMLGGVLAYEGQVRLPVMLAVAVTAAIAGDTAGYELGRRFGSRLLGWERLRRRFGDQLDRTETYLRERGATAVLVGRWTSVFRTLVPPMAGAAGMPYGRFAVANVAGGLPWAVTFVLLGYAAGASWRRVEQAAGRASLLLLVVIAAALVIRLVARQIMRRREAIVGWFTRLGQRPAVHRLRVRYRTQLAWAARRFDPRLTDGLGLTAAVAAVVAGCWALGEVTQDLLAGEELFAVDQAVVGWIAAQREPFVVAVARPVAGALTWPWVAATIVVCATVAWWLAGRRAAVRVVVGISAAVAAAVAADALVPVRAGTIRFPAVATATVAAVAVHLTAATGVRFGWAAAVRAAAVGVFVVVLVGVAVLVVGAAALSGVLAGAAVGAVLAGLVEVQGRLRLAGRTARHEATT